MKRMTLVFLAVLSLSGCKEEMKEIGAQFEKLAPDREPMTIVIWPNYKVMVGGKTAMVFGSDICPPTESFFSGQNPSSGKPECIVITPETTSVLVKVWLPEGDTAEVWSVERSADRMMLRRRDGSLIGAAPQIDEDKS
jgi:hypothetical protein